MQYDENGIKICKLQCLEHSVRAGQYYARRVLDANVCNLPSYYQSCREKKGKMTDN